MDISYILLNTIIYGCCALILVDIFSYWKIFSFAIGSYLMFSAYIIFNCVKYWFNIWNISAIVVLIVSFFLINYLLINKFSEKKRGHASLIITLWVSLFLDNFCNYIYWWHSVSLPSEKLSLIALLTLFIIIFLVFFYFHRVSCFSKILSAIWENERLICGLWIRKNRIMWILFWIVFVLIVLLWYILLINSSIKMQSWLFYLIKGMWIMILVWLAKKERIFLWALIYVLLEYLLFNKLGLSIAYKETVILLCIVLVLLFKPEWLFSLIKRKI